jgi:cytochrome c oxidase subunit 2
VLHSFYIPAFRIKEDCVPGMETYLWFTARQTGSFDIFCTEYCGLGHSGMIARVQVDEPSAFDEWYKTAQAASGGGAQLLKDKGCLGCHSTDGTPKIGPTLKGIYGRKVVVLTGGKERTITADGDYIRRSILDPGADVVKGFPAIMPKLPLTKEELDAIEDYLEHLK